MSEEDNKKDLSEKLFELVALDPDTLRETIWRETGFTIGKDDPIQIAHVIYAASIQDQVRLLKHHKAELDRLFCDQLEVFHTETETIVKGIQDEISSQTIKERMTVMADQISRADSLAQSIRSNARLFKVLTFLNLLSACVVLTILILIMK